MKDQAIRKRILGGALCALLAVGCLPGAAMAVEDREEDTTVDGVFSDVLPVESTEEGAAASDLPTTIDESTSTDTSQVRNLRIAARSVDTSALEFGFVDPLKTLTSSNLDEAEMLSGYEAFEQSIVAVKWSYTGTDVKSWSSATLCNAYDESKVYATVTASNSTSLKNNVLYFSTAFPSCFDEDGTDMKLMVTVTKTGGSTDTYENGNISLIIADSDYHYEYYIQPTNLTTLRNRDEETNFYIPSSTTVMVNSLHAFNWVENNSSTSASPATNETSIVDSIYVKKYLEVIRDYQLYEQVIVAGAGDEIVLKSFFDKYRANSYYGANVNWTDTTKTCWYVEKDGEVLAKWNFTFDQMCNAAPQTITMKESWDGATLGLCLLDKQGNTHEVLNHTTLYLYNNTKPNVEFTDTAIARDNTISFTRASVGYTDDYAQVPLSMKITGGVGAHSVVITLDDDDTEYAWYCDYTGKSEDAGDYVLNRNTAVRGLASCEIIPMYAENITLGVNRSCETTDVRVIVKDLLGNTAKKSITLDYQSKPAMYNIKLDDTSETMSPISTLTVSKSDYLTLNAAVYYGREGSRIEAREIGDGPVYDGCDFYLEYSYNKSKWTYVALKRGAKRQIGTVNVSESGSTYTCARYQLTSSVAVSSFANLSNGFPPYWRVRIDYEGGSGVFENWTSFSTEPVTVTLKDEEAPTISNFKASTTAWTNQNVELTATVKDNVGVTRYCFSNSRTVPAASSSLWTTITSTTSKDISKTITATANNGIKNWYLHVKDAAGNVATSSSYVTTKIDTVATTISSVEVPSGYAASKTVKVWMQDALSGSYQANYSLTDVEPTSGWSTSKDVGNVGERWWTWTVKSNGDRYYWAKDQAGNVTKYGPVTISGIDTTTPVVTGLTASTTAWTNSDVTLTATATDDYYSTGNGSYVAGYYFSTSSTKPSASANGWQTENAYTVVADKDTHKNDGQTTWYCWAKDVLGNVSSNVKYVTIKIDTTAPADLEGTLMPQKSEGYAKSVTLQLSATDVGVGLDELPYYCSTGGWTTHGTYTLSNNGTYTIKADDDLYNRAEGTVTIDYIDNLSPTATSVLQTGCGQLQIKLEDAAATTTSGQSGISRYCVTKSSTPPSSGWSSATSPTASAIYGGLNQGQNYYIHMKDAAGNQNTYGPVRMHVKAAVNEQKVDGVTGVTSVTKYVGESVTFSVSANASANNYSESVSYQWYYKTPSGTSSFINGATSSTYTLNSVELAKSGYQYCCKVTNTTAKGATDVSDTAKNDNSFNVYSSWVTVNVQKAGTPNATLSVDRDNIKSVVSEGQYGQPGLFTEYTAGATLTSNAGTTVTDNLTTVLTNRIYNDNASESGYNASSLYVPVTVNVTTGSLPSDVTAVWQRFGGTFSSWADYSGDSPSYYETVGPTDSVSGYSYSSGYSLRFKKTSNAGWWLRYNWRLKLTSASWTEPVYSDAFCLAVDTSAPVITDVVLIPEVDYYHNKYAKIYYTESGASGGLYGYNIDTSSDSISVNKQWDSFTLYNDQGNVVDSGYGVEDDGRTYVTVKLHYNGYYYLYLMDKAGNISACKTFTADGIDWTAPVASYTDEGQLTFDDGSNRGGLSYIMSTQKSAFVVDGNTYKKAVAKYNAMTDKTAESAKSTWNSRFKVIAPTRITNQAKYVVVKVKDVYSDKVVYNPNGTNKQETISGNEYNESLSGVFGAMCEGSERGNMLPSDLTDEDSPYLLCEDVFTDNFGNTCVVARIGYNTENLRYDKYVCVADNAGNVANYALPEMPELDKEAPVIEWEWKENSDQTKQVQYRTIHITAYDNSGVWYESGLSVRKIEQGINDGGKPSEWWELKNGKVNDGAYVENLRTGVQLSRTVNGTTVVYNNAVEFDLKFTSNGEMSVWVADQAYNRTGLSAHANDSTTVITEKDGSILIKNIDKVPPEVTNLTLSGTKVTGSTWYSSNVKLTATAKDYLYVNDSTENKCTMQYLFSTNPNAVNNPTKQSGDEIWRDGSRKAYLCSGWQTSNVYDIPAVELYYDSAMKLTFYCWAKDEAGNVSAAKTYTIDPASTNVGIDLTAPVVTGYTLELLRYGTSDWITLDDVDIDGALYGKTAPRTKSMGLTNTITRTVWDVASSDYVFGLYDQYRVTIHGYDYQSSVCGGGIKSGTGEGGSDWKSTDKDAVIGKTVSYTLTTNRTELAPNECLYLGNCCGLTSNAESRRVAFWFMDGGEPTVGSANDVFDDTTPLVTYGETKLQYGKPVKNVRIWASDDQINNLTYWYTTEEIVVSNNLLDGTKVRDAAGDNWTAISKISDQSKNKQNRPCGYIDVDLPAGTYYFYVKDHAGNVSQGKEVKVFTLSQPAQYTVDGYRGTNPAMKGYGSANVSVKALNFNGGTWPDGWRDEAGVAVPDGTDAMLTYDWRWSAGTYARDTTFSSEQLAALFEAGIVPTESSGQNLTGFGVSCHSWHSHRFIICRVSDPNDAENYEYTAVQLKIDVPPTFKTVEPPIVTLQDGYTKAAADLSLDSPDIVFELSSDYVYPSLTDETTKVSFWCSPDDVHSDSERTWYELMISDGAFQFEKDGSVICEGMVYTTDKRYGLWFTKVTAEADGLHFAVIVENEAWKGASGADSDGAVWSYDISDVVLSVIPYVTLESDGPKCNDETLTFTAAISNTASKDDFVYRWYMTDEAFVADSAAESVAWSEMDLAELGMNEIVGTDTVTLTGTNNWDFNGKYIKLQVYMPGGAENLEGNIWTAYSNPVQNLVKPKIPDLYVEYTDIKNEYHAVWGAEIPEDSDTGIPATGWSVDYEVYMKMWDIDEDYPNSMRYYSTDKGKTWIFDEGMLTANGFPDEGVTEIWAKSVNAGLESATGEELCSDMVKLIVKKAITVSIEETPEISTTPTFEMVYLDATTQSLLYGKKVEKLAVIEKPEGIAFVDKSKVTENYFTWGRNDANNTFAQWYWVRNSTDWSGLYAFQLYNAAAYDRAEDMKLILAATDEERSYMAYITITVKGVEDKQLDYTMPLNAELTLKPGLERIAYSETLTVRNKNAFPLEFPIASVTAAEADSQQNLTKLQLVQPSYIIQDTEELAQVKLGVEYEDSSGETVKVYYNPTVSDSTKQDFFGVVYYSNDLQFRYFIEFSPKYSGEAMDCKYTVAYAPCVPD